MEIFSYFIDFLNGRTADYTVIPAIGAIFGVVFTYLLSRRKNDNEYVINKNTTTNYNFTINNFIINHGYAESQSAAPFIIVLFVVFLYSQYASQVIGIAYIFCAFIVSMSIVNLYVFIRSRFINSYIATNCLVSIFIQLISIINLYNSISKYNLYISDGGLISIQTITYSLGHILWFILQATGLFFTLISMYLCFIKMINFSISMSISNLSSSFKLSIFRLTHGKSYSLAVAMVTVIISYLAISGKIYVFMKNNMHFI